MNGTTRCEFCGEPLEPLTIDLPGRPGMHVDWRPCGCDAARAHRMARMREADERERADSERRLEAKLRRAGVPERYVRAEHDRAAALADSVLAGTGFYLDGTQGTGKTHLAAAVARILAARGCSVEFRVAPALMEQLRSRASEDREATARLATCDLLVLDDLGKESPTAYACERLFDVVNERYNAMKPVVVTSNCTRGEIARRLVEGDVGRSIASRLVEMTRRVHMDGDDRRLSHG